MLTHAFVVIYTSHPKHAQRVELWLQQYQTRSVVVRDLRELQFTLHEQPRAILYILPAKSTDTRELQQVIANSHFIPVMVLATRPSTQQAVQTMQVGAHHYLPASAEGVAQLHVWLSKHPYQTMIPSSLLSLHANPLGTLIANIPAGSIIEVNEQLTGLFRVNRESLIGQTLSSLFPHDSERICQLLNPDSSYSSVECTFHDPYQQNHYVQLLRAHVIDWMGQSAVVIIFHDLTSLREAEARLRRQQRLIDSVSDAIIVTDEQFIITDWNLAAEHIYGWDKNEVIGKSIESILKTTFEAPATAEESIAALYRYGFWLGEVIQYDRHGQPLTILASISTLRDNDGRMIGAIGVNRNITDRHRTEAALRRSEERQQALLRAIPDIMFHIEVLPNNTCRFVDFSAPDARELIIAPDHIVGRDIHEVLPYKMASRMQSLIERAISSGEIQTYEYQLPISGEERHYEARISPFSDSDVLVIVRNISTRVKAERAIRQREAEFKALVENSPEPVTRFDRELRIIYANPSLAKLYQRPLSEIIGKTNRELGTPESANAPFEATARHVFATGETSTYTASVTLRDGTPKSFQIRLAPEFGPDGFVETILTSAADITQLLEMAEALQASERRSRAVFDSLFQFTSLLDPAGTVLSVNQATLDFSGMRLNEIINRPFWEGRLWQIDQETQTALREALARAAQGNFVRYQVNVLRYDRSVATVDFSIKPVFDEQGQVVWLIPEGRDISDYIRTQQELEELNRTLEARVAQRTAELGATNRELLNEINERRSAEAALAQQLRYDESLMAATPDMIYVFDLSHNRFLSITKAVTSLLGYTPEEIVEHHADYYLSLVHPDDRHLLEEMSQGINKISDQQVLEREYRIRAKNGEWRWINSRDVVLQRDEQGHVQITLGCATDISQRRQTEEALRRANEDLSIANAQLARAARLKDEFLANMSHELRTPLNAILGRAETLIEQSYGALNEKQSRFITAIEESGRHLLELINDILDLSKIEAGRLELDPAPTSIDSVCQASMRMVAQSAHKKHHRISLALDPNIRTVWLDERRFKQILVNLLSNAVKFTPDGGTISLKVQGHSEQQMVSFSVSDTGIGIATDDLPRLFRPFIQLDSRLSRQYEGTGLGLALVARLTELHGGSVTVQSTVGQGSQFTITIPWRTTADMNPHPLNATNHLTPLLELAHHSLSIVLAEDNEENISLLSDYLSSYGHQLIVARNGAEAYERTQQHRPDLILMDVQMPGVDGLTAIKQIRNNPGLAHIPIIALTALAMPGDRERCLQAGANEYFSKPVAMRTLLQAINTLTASVRSL